MTDEQLIEISRGVDSYITTMLSHYDITPLSLAAVLLARTMLLNKEAGSMDDFLKLLTSVSTNPPIEPTTNVH